MKNHLINILRWIGTVVLPIPVMMILPPIVAFGLSLSGIIEPDTFAGQYIRALINGLVIPFVPWSLAPKHKTIAGISVAVIYFFIGLIFTVFMYKDPHSGTLGQTFVLIGMILGISIIAYQGYEEHKEKESTKDACDLISIAKDFLPKETFDKYNLAERGHTLNNMYDQYLSILIWLWTEHLKQKKSDLDFFVKAINNLAPDATYASRMINYELRYACSKDPLDEYLFSSLPKKSVEYIRQLSYVINRSARNLVGECEKEIALAKEFAILVIEFMKANNL